MAGKHGICEHCGREIFFPDAPPYQWLHWGSQKASCGMEAEPRRGPS
jgi:hypothetical protein